jgi:hypothetical protein
LDASSVLIAGGTTGGGRVLDAEDDVIRCVIEAAVNRTAKASTELSGSARSRTTFRARPHRTPASDRICEARA